VQEQFYLFRMKIKSKILVTGGNGQLGKELREFSSLHTGLDFVFLSREELPIHQFELVRNYFNTLKPAYCINCAAYTAVDKAESEKDLAFQINGEAVGVLAAVCREHNSKLIHISTDYVFNGEASYPYTENFPTDPINVYGASKLEGEKQAMELNPGSIIIRTSWLYSSLGKNFVKTMIQLMNEKDEVKVIKDQLGCPTNAADLAETIFNIIGYCHLQIYDWSPGIYNYSNEGIISWYDFAKAIKEITASPCDIKPISTAQYPTPAKRPAYSVLDKTKIQKTFGIKLKKWKDSLRTCISNMQN
ncbi:MAG TPA: dTDP-4-dehydrorhamnose reductase, partial [Chitinophagaceae bacterium]|nr:dTDP-4-dehydrorhamnose reductase [Chitinophagaceae bacterium]